MYNILKLDTHTLMYKGNVIINVCLSEVNMRFLFCFNPLISIFSPHNIYHVEKKKVLYNEYSFNDAQCVHNVIIRSNIVEQAKTSQLKVSLRVQ